MSKPGSRPKSKATATLSKPIRRTGQLALPLPALPAPRPKGGTWGGARQGAGRKRSGKAGVPHRARPLHNWRHPVHVSLKLDPTLPNLRSPACIRTIEACFRALQLANEKKRAGRAQQLQHDGTGTKGSIGFRLVHYSVQPHHLHLLVEAQDGATLARGTKGLSVRIARQLNKLLGRRGRVFVDRYFARALKTPRETRKALRYVLLNTSKHEAQRRRGRGRAAQVAERGKGWLDPCSSGVYFDGWKEGNFRERWIEELTRRQAQREARRAAQREARPQARRNGRGGPERRAVERAKLVLPVMTAATWLLQRGWKLRWGLISLNEVPELSVRNAHEVHAAQRGQAG